MYLLDANVFINAYRDYYSFDIVPDFWNRLVSLAGNSQICSIDKIRDELCTNIENPDELHIWSASQFEAYFKETDATDVIEAYSRIQQWAFGNPQFTEAAKSEFASNADAWLIAYAKAKNATVVTHEAFNRDVRKRI